MADQVIDKLIFALGGDTGPLKDAYAQAEAGAQKTGAAIQQNLGKGFKDAAAQASQGSGALGKALGEAADHTERLGRNINVSRREMVYFVREMATGDIQRMPATLALLVSHFLGLSGAAIVAGAAVAAPFIAIAVSAAKADAALAKLRTSIALTGSASGVSAAGAAAIAANLPPAGRLSAMGAEGIIGGLAKDMVPGAQLGNAATAVGNYTLATGQKNEEVTKMVADMFSDPEKSAKELNTTQRLLTAAQTQQVQKLTEEGNTEAAGAIILQSFNDRAREAADGASTFAIAMRNGANLIQNIGKGIAHASGMSDTLYDKKQTLEQERRGYISHDVPGSITQTRHLAGVDSQISQVNAQIVADFQKHYAEGLATNREAMANTGLEVADKGANSFQAKKDAAEAAAVAAHSRFDAARMNTDQDSVTKPLQDSAKALDIVAASIKKYGSPEQEAQQRLKDAKELFRTPIERQGEVAARQQADARYRTDLQNPQTALQADAIHKIDLQAAAFNRADANKAKEQDKRVATIEAQAAAALKVADAYGISTAAGDKARIEGEVEVQVKDKQIRASQAHTVALSKEAIAYASASEAASKEIEQLGRSNAGLALEVAAGGNPQAVAQAKRQAEADAFAQKLLDKADPTDPMALADIGAKKSAYLTDITEKDRGNALIGLNATETGAKQNLGNLQGQVGAFTGGASDDYLRHLKIQQDAIDQVTKELQKSDPLYQQHIDDLTKTNTAISDLTDSFTKMQAEAKGLATDITGGLGNFLAHPGGNPMDALAGIGQNMLNTVVQSQILEPMNKWLTSQFAGLLGDGQLGSGPGNAMYVQFSPASPGNMGMPGGGGGGNSGGGGILGWLGNLVGLGGSTAAADPFASVIGSTMGDVALMASGGPLEAGKSYIVGEAGPEFITANMGGMVTPLSAPVVRAALGSQVSGNGTSYGGAGNSTVQRGGDAFHFHLPGVTDPTSFIRSKSQLAAAVTSATSMGRRNK